MTSARPIGTLATLARLATLLGLLALPACLELSGPEDGAASIGTIRAQWPSVVIGDTLRDSTGAIAPLRVAAFDADGDTLRDAPVQFIVVGDPVRVLRVDAAGHVIGLALRDTVIGSDSVFALIGGLQTPRLVLAAVPRPDYVTRPAAEIPEQSLTLTPGDTAPRSTSAAMTVQVWHREATGDSVGVPAWIVSYEIVRQPQTTDQLPGAFLGSGSTRSSRDTTDASGTAGRTLLVRAHRLASLQDTVVVRARVVHRGTPLPGVETLEFRVPIRVTTGAR